MDELAAAFLHLWLEDLKSVEPIYGPPVKADDGSGNVIDGGGELLGYRIAPMSPERLNWLIRALQRAHEGHSDPFGLRPKGRPKLRRSRLFLAACWVQSLRAHGRSLQDAVDAVSERAGISARSLSVKSLLSEARAYLKIMPKEQVLMQIAQEFHCKKSELFLP